MKPRPTRALPAPAHCRSIQPPPPPPIRGFGPVKAAAMARAQAERSRLRAAFDAASRVLARAA